MGGMPSIITILWTQRGGKRGSIESSFVLSTFLSFPVKMKEKKEIRQFIED